MGHASLSTTEIYMHDAPKNDAAQRLTAAFGVASAGAPVCITLLLEGLGPAARHIRREVVATGSLFRFQSRAVKRPTRADRWARLR